MSGQEKDIPPRCAARRSVAGLLADLAGGAGGDEHGADLGMAGRCGSEPYSSYCRRPGAVAGEDGPCGLRRGADPRQLSRTDGFVISPAQESWARRMERAQCSARKRRIQQPMGFFTAKRTR